MSFHVDLFVFPAYCKMLRMSCSIRVTNDKAFTVKITTFVCLFQFWCTKLYQPINNNNQGILFILLLQVCELIEF